MNFLASPGDSPVLCLQSSLHAPAAVIVTGIMHVCLPVFLCLRMCQVFSSCYPPSSLKPSTQQVLSKQRDNLTFHSLFLCLQLIILPKPFGKLHIIVHSPSHTQHVKNESYCLFLMPALLFGRGGVCGKGYSFLVNSLYINPSHSGRNLGSCSSSFPFSASCNNTQIMQPHKLPGLLYKSSPYHLSPRVLL